MFRATRLTAALSICLFVAATTGCTTKRGGLAARFVKPGEPAINLGDPIKPSDRDLEHYTKQLRALQSKATTKSSLLPTIEGRDPVLAETLFRLKVFETAEGHRQVAAAYRDAGVTDYAFKHYQRALQLESCDSLAYEGLAQLWRDWLMPDIGLGDAYRAIGCRPASASAYNTLGTVLQRLGQTTEAKRAFARAVELDPHAAFALNNLCYIALRVGNGHEAQQSCERALAEDPALVTARLNLALARAMQGDVAGAERQLLDYADVATGQFNVGLLRMSMGRYAEAVESFDAVVAERPQSRTARMRAKQARARLVEERKPNADR
ncbi:MAG TPA: tetratricopeptide repeat protein [Vicinamibacterales bacterium]|nr:tetratricopeptide repeat protein [Vicinamibacterales bacterium]